MKTAIIFDCEFLCLEGSQRRFWCAAHDPDPVIVQIGAVKLGLEGEFPILDTHRSYVRPIDRFGKQYPLDPYFTKLTGITEEDIDAHGVALEDALSGVDSFSGGARFWSWGKDELNMLAISCYVAGLQPSIPARRFDNAVKLLVAAGMSIEDLAKTPSNKLAEYYEVEHPPLRGHNALDDALSISYTLRHLMKIGKLQPEVFDRT
ncbi:exonuclease domain-containing protein [Rhizobium leguminosarum]|uniref:3'-5' exonuclease n=1 Tax=Rhizobium TaxID=379 RepID=UPI001C90EF97|nr:MULTISPECIES: 3'-5' exonuclease [Rhizobium]MBY3035704.1 exonuclease domain-containing protein [Rhizobium laguerreae]MBY5647493.1 exonuclease domain-containing protein [Rhizobium leguminosarum]